MPQLLRPSTWRHKWALFLAVVFFMLAFVCSGCAGDRYRIVDGPAKLAIGATPFTPGVQVEIEPGGKAYFGPTAPPADLLEEKPADDEPAPEPAEKTLGNGKIDTKRSGSRASETIAEDPPE